MRKGNFVHRWSLLRWSKEMKMYIFLAPSYYSIIEVFIYSNTTSNQYDSTTMNQQICTSAKFLFILPSAADVRPLKVLALIGV